MGKSPYDGEHLTARFSVSTGVKKENSMRIKVRKNIKRIIEVYSKNILLQNLHPNSKKEQVKLTLTNYFYLKIFKIQ